MTRSAVLRALACGLAAYAVLLFVLGLPTAGADSLDTRDWGFVVASGLAALAAGLAASWQGRLAGLRGRVALVACAVVPPTALCWLILATNGRDRPVKLLCAVLTPLAAWLGARALEAAVGRAARR